MSFCFSSLNGSLWLCHHIFITSKCVHREKMFSAFLSLKGKYCMFKNLYSRDSRQFQGMKSMRHLPEYWYVTPPPLQTLKNWHVLKVTEDKEQFVTDRLRSNLMGRPLGGWTFGVMKRGGRWGREQNGLAVRCNLPFSLSNSSLLG